MGVGFDQDLYTSNNQLGLLPSDNLDIRPDCERNILKYNHTIFSQSWQLRQCKRSCQNGDVSDFVQPLISNRELGDWPKPFMQLKRLFFFRDEEVWNLVMIDFKMSIGECALDLNVKLIPSLVAAAALHCDHAVIFTKNISMAD